MSGEPEWPTAIGELSRHMMDKAIETLEAELSASTSADVRSALAVIRLIARTPAATPWWGQVIDPRDSSVHVGVMMRNAFEALGEDIGLSDQGLVSEPKSWFTRLYLDRWVRGRREYYDFLDHLTDPARWEADQARALIDRGTYEAGMAHVREIARERP